VTNSEERLFGKREERERAKALKERRERSKCSNRYTASFVTKGDTVMDWLVVIVVILFFTVAILTSDYWLDKIFGQQPVDTWDETQKWNDLRQRLEPEITKDTGGLDYLEYYYDFRHKREDPS
jgi:hypothetical protein